MAQMKMLLVLSLLLILTLAAESRTIGIAAARNAKGSGGDAVTVDCNSVHGAEDGDTCFSVAQAFNLSSEEFLEINPNINCNSIFNGQWLCVGGSVSP